MIRGNEVGFSMFVASNRVLAVAKSGGGMDHMMSACSALGMNNVVVRVLVAPSGRVGWYVATRKEVGTLHPVR